MIAGTLMTIQEKKSSKGTPFAIAKFSDKFGEFALFIFFCADKKHYIAESKIDSEIKLEKRVPKIQKKMDFERSRQPQSTRIFSKIAFLVEIWSPIWTISSKP